MPFTSRRDTPIDDFRLRIWRLADAHDVFEVVGRLRFGHLDPEGRENRIGNSSTVRLDRQPNPTGGGANLQIQVNAAALGNLRPPQKNDEGTTVAQVLVFEAIFLACPQQNNARTHFENVVRSALLQSYYGEAAADRDPNAASGGLGYQYIIEGTWP